MADANAVMQPVKTRADPEPIAPATEPGTQVGVLQALTELGDRDDRDEEDDD